MWNVCFVRYVFLKIITMPVKFKMMKFIGPWSLNRSHFLDSNMNLQPAVCVESAKSAESRGSGGKNMCASQRSPWLV